MNVVRRITMSVEKLRILHIVTSLRNGGAEHLAAGILTRLKERGHDVRIMIFDGTETSLYERLVSAGVPVYGCGRGAFDMWNPFHAFKIGRMLRSGQFDIVHTHNTPCQLLTALAAGDDAPKLVTTEHNTRNKRRAWRWFRPVDKWMYGKYDRIVCVSRLTRENLEKSVTISAGKISVICNGTDLGRIVGAVPDSQSLSDSARGKHIVLMVSAFRKQKDQPTLIRAMSLLPDNYVLRLAGGWRQRRECEKLAESLGLGDRVEFLGERSDIPSLLATADAVVLSSHYEGMSLSCIEGMASGKPFIASDVEGLREVVDGAGLLFPHEDHVRLAELIRRVCEEPEFGAEVAARCRQRAMQYDMESVVDSYERLYRDLMKENG